MALIQLLLLAFRVLMPCSNLPDAELIRGALNRCPMWVSYVHAPPIPNRAQTLHTDTHPHAQTSTFPCREKVSFGQSFIAQLLTL